MGAEQAQDRARYLAEKGYGRKRIREQTGISDRQAKAIIQSVRGVQAPWTPKAEREVLAQAIPSGTLPRKYHYEEAAEALNDWIGKRTQSQFQPLVAVKATQGPVKTAVFSDIHMPFHNREALLAAVVKARNLGCSQLLLAGDTFDLYRLSSYAKSKQIRLQDEIAEAVASFEWLCAQFETVKLFWGNHEEGRYKRNFLSLIPEEWRFMVKGIDTVFGLDDIPNLERVGHTTPWGKEMVWLYQLGEDAIITHCERSASAQGQNVEKLYGWLQNWAEVLNLPTRPRLVTAGHTHRLTRLDHHNAMLIETGMMALPCAQEYQIEADIRSTRPGTLGFAVITQQDGRTLLDESGIVRINP